MRPPLIRSSLNVLCLQCCHVKPLSISLRLSLYILFFCCRSQPLFCLHLFVRTQFFSISVARFPHFSQSASRCCLSHTHSLLPLSVSLQKAVQRRAKTVSVCVWLLLVDFHLNTLQPVQGTAAPATHKVKSVGFRLGVRFIESTIRWVGYRLILTTCFLRSLSKSLCCCRGWLLH